MDSRLESVALSESTLIPSYSTWMSHHLSDAVVAENGSQFSILTHLPGQNGRHFTDDMLRCIFVNEKFRILTKISLKFIPKGPIDNNPALV